MKYAPYESYPSRDGSAVEKVVVTVEADDAYWLIGRILDEMKLAAKTGAKSFDLEIIVKEEK